MINLLRFNRLFWKIFAAIWLTNMAIIVVVIISMAYAGARSKYVANYEFQIERLAGAVVEAYEQEKGFPFGKSRDFAKLKHRLHVQPDILLDITKGDGTIVYQSHKRYSLAQRLKKQSPNKPIRLERRALQSESGSQYFVEYIPHRAPLFIRQALAGVVSMQFILMFFASAFISALISWRIIKPLKRLGQFGLNYSRSINSSVCSGHNLKLDENLLMRGDEIGDLAREFSKMVAKIDDTFKAQRDLLHDVSHELRAPLARLQLCASIFEQSNPDNKNVLKMHLECERLNRLIDQILEFSRLNIDDQDFKPVNLTDLLSNIVNDVHYEFPNHNIVANLADFDADITVNGNVTLLTRIFENIFRNACKHTSNDALIKISTEENLNGWMINCVDNGAGVNDDEIDQLTQAFYRGGNLMHTEGFGLGLSIANKAVKLHGGELSISNQLEGGLSVAVWLPKPTII